ncbi:hypothetical protein RvY_03158 [Ramazzottius varieornatus]|uniref:Uncharacterized protein n=1 Tax=Ramazzottius varieornatus TaxID=947166 RepID=A0A1D1UXA3_RAMVA|nr:hypothetical protein RvY_03158 [Ramazzottius varieornatus]
MREFCGVDFPLSVGNVATHQNFSSVPLLRSSAFVLSLDGCSATARRSKLKRLLAIGLAVEFLKFRLKARLKRNLTSAPLRYHTGWARSSRNLGRPTSYLASAESFVLEP